MDVNKKLMKSLQKTAETFKMKEEKSLGEWESELPAPKRIANGKDYKILVCGGTYSKQTNDRIY